jgi:hypothetical protein
MSNILMTTNNKNKNISNHFIMYNSNLDLNLNVLINLDSWLMLLKHK